MQSKSSQEKGEIIFEIDAKCQVDEFGFFIYWKSEGRVSQQVMLINVTEGGLKCIAGRTGS